MSHFIGNYHHHDRFCLGSRGMYCTFCQQNPCKHRRTPLKILISTQIQTFRLFKKNGWSRLLFESWTKRGWCIILSVFPQPQPIQVSTFAHSCCVCVCVDPVEQSTKLSKLPTKLENFPKNWDLTKKIKQKIGGVATCNSRAIITDA